MKDALEEGNTKPFWKYIKSKRQDSSGISPLLGDGKLHSDSQDQANILNQQFCSVFTKDKGDPTPTINSEPTPTIQDLTSISARGVEKLLSTIKDNKASGPDNIPNRLLRELAPQLSHVLAVIFTQSLTSGHLPKDWKEANIAPIFKKDNKNNPANYRPVSLTCVCAKLMEHIVVHHLMAHLESHQVLTPLQHGFRARHSCVTQLISTVTHLLGYQDNNTQVDVIILDFSKAFDVVSHRKLLAKLDHYGVRGNIHKWIASFLTNRSQRVLVKGTMSESAPVESGVPQGTCLGPILFLCFINDIADGISSFIRLFADDALLYRPIRTPEDHTVLQEDLAELEEWAAKWGMKFNPKKCYAMSTTKKKSIPSIHFYTLCNVVLSSVANNPYLGINISEDLTFAAHINKTVAKSSRTLGFLNRTMRSCPRRLRELAYFTMCRTTLEYASQVWDPPDNSREASNLEKVQRRAARFVVKDYRRRASVTAILQDLGWEPLSSRRQNSRLTLFHQIVNNKLDVQLEEGMLVQGLRGRYRLGRSKTSQHKNSFFPRTITAWNNLKPGIRESLTTDSLKAALPKAAY